MKILVLGYEGVRDMDTCQNTPDPAHSRTPYVVIDRDLVVNDRNPQTTYYLNLPVVAVSRSVASWQA